MAKKESQKDTAAQADTQAAPQADATAGTQQVDAQAREQTGQQQVRLRVDSRDMGTSYANAFRTHGTAEEVIIDFGLNMVVQAPNQAETQDAVGDSGAGSGNEILFKLNDRLVMNYYSAKRLAITLGQIIRRHEDQFGELKLNVSDRVRQ